MAKPSHQRLIVCCTAFGEDWTWFLQELTLPNVRWRFFSDLPQYPWQNLFRKPNLNTMFAGLRTVLEARRHQADLIITHGPRYSFWVGFWSRLLNVKTRHMVFSFNFPELPAPWKIKLFRYAFQSLDLIRVHSSMEIDLYHQLFSIPLERIHLALWSMNPPVITPLEPLMPTDYIAAIGGNSRDYETLLAASNLVPQIPMVWVVRPENIDHLTLPPQITTFCNIPYPTAMNYLAHSRAMVLPLKSSATPCGHVTLVSAMFLSKAIVATDSVGICDYVAEGINGTLCLAADPSDLANKMLALWNDPQTTKYMGTNGLRFAERHCNEALVRIEMQTYFAEHGLATPVTPQT